MTQYNVSLAIPDAIKETSKEKLYDELGQEYLRDRRWIQRLYLFLKIFNLKSPKYLYDLIIFMQLEIIKIFHLLTAGQSM